MTLVVNPEKLLEVIWSGRFAEIFIYKDGTWGIDERKRDKDSISLSRSQLTETTKLEALNQLMILNTSLLEATTEEYAKIAQEEYELEKSLWEEQERGSKEYAEYCNKEYKETSFEYSPFPTLEQRIEEYCAEYYFDYISLLEQQLGNEHDLDLKADFGGYIHSPEEDSSYFQTPFNDRVAFYIAGSKGNLQCYVDDKHPLFAKLKNEVMRVTRLALEESRKSVKKDLREWFKSQFGYDIN